ncbi:hypothetical protein NHX12_018769 [Muraenolepis orangiensis]|uniref:Mitotic spindle assembly checkpoint protein MAD1 n=1 Tax=Muraenolepis orangiensis TaxID=630683 RepID=A0A9Q0EX75_9TELE|nr:hypothetical protein NHX12_018769 [Muraenolepis orangiensis]
MEMDDETTVFTTLKSFHAFIGRPDLPKEPSEQPIGGSNLQTRYTQAMEMLEAAEKVRSLTEANHLDQEKMQLELSHKRARYDLEKVASDSARHLEHELDRNQELQERIKRLEQREEDSAKTHSEQLQTNRALHKNLHDLKKKVDERDMTISTTNQTISSLKDEIRELKQTIQKQDCTILAKNLENQSLQEQLDQLCRKRQEVNQLCQSHQSSQNSLSEHEIKIKELERRLYLQDQDIALVKTTRSHAAKVQDLDKEVCHLREDNAYLRGCIKNTGLLKEEVIEMRNKLARMEKTKEDFRLNEKLQVWENLGQSTGLNIRKPEDLSREVIQIQQREMALKEENNVLSIRMRSTDRSKCQLQGETLQQRSKALEELKKKEAQDSLVRRLQKRVLLLSTERDGMRAILESYDSELAHTEYSPQLNMRLRAAEDIVRKTQNHNAEMEAQLNKAQEETGTLKLKLKTVSVQQKIEDGERERQRLEQRNYILEMRYQGDFDPVQTRVLHFKLNPTDVAKQQRQQEMEALRAEVTCLREHLRSLKGAGSLSSQDNPNTVSQALSLCLPPSQEVLGNDLRKQLESSQMKNQRLREVFQTKIQEFRIACYMLMGYQVDITTENHYRLTSVYAEHMDDSLVFKKEFALSSPGPPTTLVTFRGKG